MVITCEVCRVPNQISCKSRTCPKHWRRGRNYRVTRLDAGGKRRAVSVNDVIEWGTRAEAEGVLDLCAAWKGLRVEYSDGWFPVQPE